MHPTARDRFFFNNSCLVFILCGIDVERHFFLGWLSFSLRALSPPLKHERAFSCLFLCYFCHPMKAQRSFLIHPSKASHSLHSLLEAFALNKDNNSSRETIKRDVGGAKKQPSKQTARRERRREQWKYSGSGGHIIALLCCKG